MIEQYLQFAIQFIEEIWLKLNTMFGLEETKAFKFLKPYLLQVQDNPTYMGIAITLMALLLYSLYKIISTPRKRRNKFNKLDVFKECTDIEDQFKLLGKNILQFSQQGDITKARDEYKRLISYQAQKVTDNPKSYEEKDRLLISLSLVCKILGRYGDKQPVDKKLVLLEEALNLFEKIMCASGDKLETDHQLVFFSLLAARGRMLYDNKNFDRAMEDVNEAIKLSRKLKGNFNPSGKGHLARLFVLRSTILYKNNHTNIMMAGSTFPKDRAKLVVKTCLEDVNEAISILELIKKSSPEFFNSVHRQQNIAADETGYSDSSYPVLLPKWYKLQEGLKSQI